MRFHFIYLLLLAIFQTAHADSEINLYLDTLRYLDKVEEEFVPEEAVESQSWFRHILDEAYADTIRSSCLLAGYVGYIHEDTKRCYPDKTSTYKQDKKACVQSGFQIPCNKEVFGEGICSLKPVDGRWTNSCYKSMLTKAGIKDVDLSEKLTTLEKEKLQKYYSKSSLSLNSVKKKLQLMCSDFSRIKREKDLLECTRLTKAFEKLDNADTKSAPVACANPAPTPIKSENLNSIRSIMQLSYSSTPEFNYEFDPRTMNLSCYGTIEDETCPCDGRFQKRCLNYSKLFLKKAEEDLRYKFTNIVAQVEGKKFDKVAQILLEDQKRPQLIGNCHVQFQLRESCAVSGTNCLVLYLVDAKTVTKYHEGYSVFRSELMEKVDPKEIKTTYNDLLKKTIIGNEKLLSKTAMSALVNCMKINN